MARESLDAATCRKIADEMAKAPPDALIDLPPKAVAALYATIAHLLSEIDLLREMIDSPPDDPNDGERAPKLRAVVG